MPCKQASFRFPTSVFVGENREDRKESLRYGVIGRGNVNSSRILRYRSLRIILLYGFL